MWRSTFLRGNQAWNIESILRCPAMCPKCGAKVETAVSVCVSDGPSDSSVLCHERLSKNISKQFDSTAAGPGNHILPPTGFKWKKLVKIYIMTRLSVFRIRRFFKVRCFLFVTNIRFFFFLMNEKPSLDKQNAWQYDLGNEPPWPL